MKFFADNTDYRRATKNIPSELDAITDAVLAYRPPEKAKATKEREKRKLKRAKKK